MVLMYLKSYLVIILYFFMLGTSGLEQCGKLGCADPCHCHAGATAACHQRAEATDAEAVQRLLAVLYCDGIYSAGVR